MSYQTDPGYLDFIRDLPESLKLYINLSVQRNYTFPCTFFNDFKTLCSVEIDAYVSIISIGIIVTVLRYIFDYFICRVIYIKRFYIKKFKS